MSGIPEGLNDVFADAHIKTTAGDTPMDRATLICDQMLKTFEDSLDVLDTDKAVVMVWAAGGDSPSHQGGLALAGYDELEEAITDILMQLKALVEVSGRKFVVGGGAFEGVNDEG